MPAQPAPPPPASSSPSHPRMLPYIPNEICRHIAGYLDLQTALRLMRTCRALRHAGEIRAYSMLDLTGSWKMDIHSQLESCDDGSSFDDDDYKTRAVIVDLKAKHALHALNKYPYRRSYVTTIRVEPSDGAGSHHQRAQRILDILALVSGQLRHLDIRPLPARSHWSAQKLAEYGTGEFFDRFNAANLSFGRLAKLSFVFPLEAKTPFRGWLIRMPNLEEMILSSADGGFGPDLRLARDFPQLPSIRRLTLIHFSGSEFMLATLLYILRNLEFLRLHGHWTPSSKDVSTQMIRRMTSLRTLVTCDDDPSYQNNRGIEFNLFAKAKLSTEEAAIQCGRWHEWDELVLETLPLPRDARLLRMTLLTPTMAPPSDYSLVGLAPNSVATHHIPAIFIHFLRRGPQLSSILFLYVKTAFPPPYAVDYSEPTYFVPSCQWIAEGHRGVVIRQYETPPGMDPAVFWHFRSLSRATPNQRSSHIGVQRRMCDWTHYKGRTVPRHVLNAVYRASGGDLESMEGGRGLSLERAAWRLLEDWRNEVGDESDAEDHFDPATADDDQLSDDE